MLKAIAQHLHQLVYPTWEIILETEELRGGIYYKQTSAMLVYDISGNFVRSEIRSRYLVSNASGFTVRYYESPIISQNMADLIEGSKESHCGPFCDKNRSSALEKYGKFILSPANEDGEWDMFHLQYKPKHNLNAVSTGHDHSLTPGNNKMDRETLTPRR